MELLNRHLVQELSRNFDVCLVAPSGSTESAGPGVKVFEVPLKPLQRFLICSLWTAFRTAMRRHPDVIHAGSGLTAPVAWLIARLFHAKATVYLHGLDAAAKNPVYRLFWMSAIRNMDAVIANSSATADLALNAGVCKERISIIHPGVEIQSSTYRIGRDYSFRENLHLRGKRILLSVGRLTERKGLLEFVCDVLPRIISSTPDVVFVVIGDAPSNSLFAKAQSRSAILDAAKIRGIANHIHFLGVITDRKKLAAAYRAADIHVFPVRQIAGDPEGFGMVAVEAASFGVPTVAYATGGIVDAVQDGESGILVHPGDSTAFAESVTYLLANPPDEELIYNHAKRFAWANFGEKFRKVISELTNSPTGG